jgi:DegV family protein with EDD domain
VDIDNPKLFKLVDQYGELPKTAAPSITDFIKAFSGPDEIIYVGISSLLSATVQNAILAGENVGKERVHVIDSRNLSTGIGLLVLKAADMRDRGCGAAEIENELNRLVSCVHTSFFIETLDYLYMGGRCSAMQNIVGSLLKIRPIIEVKQDGSLGIKEKIHGSRKKALKSMLDDLSANLGQVDLRRIFVTHTDCADDAAYLKEEILSMAKPEEVLITDAGSVVASHCGPGTIGILYLLK